MHCAPPHASWTSTPGGGEVLASLAPLPAAIATEPYAPNVPIATARLTPLGVDVRHGRASALPVADGNVTLVLNRHGALEAAETARVLASGGVFLTQQVGSRNDLAFNDTLGVPPPANPDTHTLDSTVSQFEAAGLVIDQAQEEYPVTHYFDVGAVVFQLRAVPGRYSASTSRRPRSACAASMRTFARPVASPSRATDS